MEQTWSRRWPPIRRHTTTFTHTMADRPKILIICDYFLPGFESGGAMRTLVNMIDRFSDRFDFRVVTRDHDGPHNLTPYCEREYRRME